MEETEQLIAQAVPRDFRARVIEGPDAGLVVRVNKRLLLGSSELCDVQLTDRAVSRRHCLLDPAATGVQVEDQGSKNGTWLGAVALTGARMPAGAEITLGKTVVRIEEDHSPEPEEEPETITRFGRFLGSAEHLQPMYRILQRAASSDVTVLLEGESGTGKELLAEALHEESARANAPFVVLDMSAIPETLIDSELFGHEQGAFTGAHEQHKGAFEEANSGTLFLDEIGELPLAAQTRLLGVLERRTFRRVGGNQPIALDVRIIAATNRNLEKEVEESRFRLDLFHRIAVALIRIPPLRDRTEDIGRLALHFADLLQPSQEATEALRSEETMARLRSYHWPGNVRELRNHVERLLIFGEAAPLLLLQQPTATASTEAVSVGEQVLKAASSGSPYRQAKTAVVDAFTALYVESMLEQHGGSVSQAAEAAGVARRHFRRLKQK